MKKKLLLFIFLANCLFTFANPTQTSYRWRNDDGNQTTATWKAADNTASTVDHLGATIRVRIQTLNTSPGFSTNFLVNPLQYSKNNGIWISISDATTNDFYFVNSTNIANNTVTTQQISTGSFTSGVFKSDNTSNSITLNSDTRTETEYSIAPSVSYDKTATYQFRILGLSTYTAYPTLDPNPSYCGTTKPVVSDIFYILNEVAVPLTASGTNLLWYSAATGGTGSTTAPTPNTSTSGITSYWVSSTNGCESARAEIIVTAYSNLPATHLNFDGINDFVQVPSGISLANSSFTFEFYAKRTLSNTYDYVFNQGSFTTNNNLHIGFTDNNTFLFAFYNNDLNISPANYVSDNAWHLWTCVYNIDTGVREVYQDGVLLVSQTGVAPYTGSGYIQIGAQLNSGYVHHFDGGLDDIRIWNIARTITQINASKDCELQGNETGLLAYYKFNQGIDASNNSTVNTLTNSVSGGVNGTLNNFVLTGTNSNWLAGSSIVTGTNCTALSASTFDVASNINVHPNPTNGTVNVEVNNLTNVSVSVYDLNGRQILNKDLSANENAIDISNFQTGMYLFKIKSSEGEIVKKVIKN